MRNLFRQMQHSNPLGMHRATLGAIGPGHTTTLHATARTYGFERPDDAEADEQNYALAESYVSSGLAGIGEHRPVVLLSATDFDFIKSDSLHICRLTPSEFAEGVVDLVHMEECVSVVVDDDDMLFSEDL